jgi:hypothetical protein
MNVSVRFYGWLLLAYPREFRHAFGDQMVQVFRDCYRAEARRGSLPGFWLRTLIDLVFTAAKERADNSGRDGFFMNRRSDTMVFLVAVGIIVIAFVLHRYGVRNNSPYVWVFGYVLDALVSTGVVGNLIVFVLNKTTKLNPLRSAITVFAVVHAVLLLLIVLISRNGPPVNWAGVLLGYLVSFVIWVGLHLAWRRPTTLSANPPSSV